MSGNLADFSGNIPENYDSGMGPIVFSGYATDMAHRAASGSPSRVLETAAGTGIVTRALRDAIPVSAHLTATDLNAGMSHEVIGRFFPADPPKFYEVPFGYHLIDPIKEALIGADFGGIEVSVVRLHRTVTDFRAFARGMVFGNPVFDQIRQRGGEEPARIQEAVAMAMKQEFGGEPSVMPFQAIVFEARKI